MYATVGGVIRYRGQASKTKKPPLKKGRTRERETKKDRLMIDSGGERMR